MLDVSHNCGETDLHIIDVIVFISHRSIHKNKTYTLFYYGQWFVGSLRLDSANIEHCGLNTLNIEIEARIVTRHLKTKPYRMSTIAPFQTCIL